MTVTDQSGNSVFSSSVRNPLLPKPIKRKVFISYYHGDSLEASRLVLDFAGTNGVFIHRALGLTFDNEIINSTSSDYVMRRIREDYLGDSSVSIVLIGPCTHSRRYVDWEIRSSLQAGATPPNGLLGILLPSGRPSHSHPRYPKLPLRFADNLPRNGLPGYARYQHYPTSHQQLREWIETAFASRSTQKDQISNTRDMMRYNSHCANCGITH